MSTAEEYPPGPRGPPVIGNTVELSRDIFAFFETLRDEYGRVASYDVFGTDACMIAHPDAIQQVLLDNHEAFEKGEVLTRNLADAMGEGLFVSGGEQWQNQRSQVQPAFYRERLTTYVPEMRATAAETVEQWHDGMVVDVNDVMTATTMGVLGRTLFGVDVTDHPIVSEASNAMLARFDTSRFWSFLPDRLPTYARDVIGLVGIGLVLAGIQYYAPLSVRDALVFDHGQVRGYTLLTAAYVHASEPHLLQNLDAYFRIVGFPYLYSVASDGRRWFWRTTLALLVVLPILTSLTSYALLPVLYSGGTPVTYGFSDVVAGFAGVLIVAVGRYVQARRSPTVAWAVSCTGGALAVAVIGIRLTGSASAAITGTVGLGAGLVVAGGWYLTAPRSQSAPRTRLGWVSETVVLGFTGVVLGTLLWDFFPPLSALNATGPTTNLVGHAAGLGWGIVLAASLHVLDRNGAFNG